MAQNVDLAQGILLGWPSGRSVVLGRRGLFCWRAGRGGLATLRRGIRIVDRPLWLGWSRLLLLRVWWVSALLALR